MTNRERLLAAVDHQGTDRVPREAIFTPPALETFKQRTGQDDPAEYFNMEMRYVFFKPPPQLADFSPYYPDGVPTLPRDDGWAVGDWGIGTELGTVFHFVKILHPLKHLTSVAELKRYPFPDPLAPARQAHLDAEVKRIRQRDLAVVGFMEWTIWEVAWEMRGMEQLCEDMVVNRPFAEYLFDRITDIRCQMAKRFAAAGVDVLKVGDDVGTQRGMMMSPEMWRQWLKPRLRQVIAAAKAVNPRLKVCYHSDGVISPIIPELIEVGVDILNPIQPECMDPFAIKREYDKDLALWGCLGTQTTMPFGSRADVQAMVTKLVRELAQGGGFVLAPTHVIEPEVPWENVTALFETADQLMLELGKELHIAEARRRREPLGFRQ